MQTHKSVKLFHECNNYLGVLASHQAFCIWKRMISLSNENKSFSFVCVCVLHVCLCVCCVSLDVLCVCVVHVCLCVYVCVACMSVCVWCMCFCVCLCVRCVHTDQRKLSSVLLYCPAISLRQYLSCNPGDKLVQIPAILLSLPCT